MNKTLKKIVAISFTLLTLLFTSACISVNLKEYIARSNEFTTSYTVEEHKEKIYQRAIEIADAIGYEGQILYDIIYDRNSDQPRHFIVEFDEVVKIYVGIDKRYKGDDVKDDYIYTRIIYGTIIKDEYYISAYGLGYDLEEYGSEPGEWDKWEEKAKRLSTPPSIYTLLDVWDCKKYNYNLYEKDNVIYYGKYELVREEWLYTIYHDKYYAKIYEATSEVWEGSYNGESREPDLDELEMNYYRKGAQRPYNYATKLEQAYIFKVYEKTN